MSNKLEEADISWVVIGSQTKPTVYPKIEWVQEIIQGADKAGIPVFLKNNLLPMLKARGFNQNVFWEDKRDNQGFEDLHLELRQEMPE